MIMTCKVTGYPIPTITFTKDGKRIMEDIMKAGERSYKVKHMKPEDAGVYRCTATNVKEKAEDVVNVSVVGKFSHL